MSEFGNGSGSDKGLKKLSYQDEVPSTTFPFEGRERALEVNTPQYFIKKYYDIAKKRQDKRKAAFTWVDWIGFFVPMWRWLRTYNIKSYLVPDICAGLCVGCMVVPQGMSYASNAGVPSVYGLYGAFSPVLAYAALGSSRQLAVGPVAVTSQLIRVQLTEHNVVPGAAAISNPNTVTGANVAVQAQYNHVTIQLAFLVAILYSAIGVLHLGFVTNFLSHSIIGGFISGNCVVIAMGQLKSITLIPLPSPAPTNVQGLLNAYFSGIDNLVWQTTLMGFLLIIMMFCMRYIGGLHPRLVYVRALAPLTACIVGWICQYGFNVVNYGIPLVGTIPAGMPPCTISWWTPLDDVGDIFPTAVIVMFVDLIESTSIARALALKNNYVLAPNQEIVALGLANFVGAAFNAYTTTGSFSRSAVNNAAGARTPFAAMVSALVVGAVLLWLTPLFQKLPACVLGAIIVAAMPALFEYEQFIYLFKVDKLDCLVWTASFCGVMFISVEIGLAIAVGLALLLVIWRSAFPSVRILGRVGSTNMYRSNKQYSDVQLTPGILCYSIDSSIYYANQQYIRDTAELYRERFSAWSTNYGVSLSYFIIDMTAVLHIDSAGIHAIEDMLHVMRVHNVQVLLANPNLSVMRSLELAGVPDLLGREWIFSSVADAHIFCKARLQEQGINVTSEDASTLVS